MTEAIRPARVEPARQVREAIVAHLRGLCGGFSNPIPPEQIRGMLDLSGSPRDGYGIIVSCADLGEHWGRNNGGVLIDVQPRIAVFTHLNDDADGSLCGALVSDVLGAMRSMRYELDGWRVMWTGNWTAGEPVMMDSFRQSELSATLPLNRLFR